MNFTKFNICNNILARKSFLKIRIILVRILWTSLCIKPTFYKKSNLILFSLLPLVNKNKADRLAIHKVIHIIHRKIANIFPLCKTYVYKSVQ